MAKIDLSAVPVKTGSIYPEPYAGMMRGRSSLRQLEGMRILVVEDNLVKGASGQGVQCLNLMFGLPETMGLTQIALSP